MIQYFGRVHTQIVSLYVLLIPRDFKEVADAQDVEIDAGTVFSSIIHWCGPGKKRESPPPYYF